MEIAIKYMQESQKLGILKVEQNKWKDYKEINIFKGGYLYSYDNQSDFVSDWDWDRVR